MSKGISGSGKGFDLPGKRLGGFSPKPPLSSLRQTALAAAEKRVRLGSLLPSGPKRLGGDSSLMAALSPLQAAAMAAERRLQDNIWCGSESYDASEEKEENNDQQPLETVHGVGSSRNSGGFGASAFEVLSQKRRHWSRETLSSQSHKGPVEPMFVDLTTGTSTMGSTLHCDEVHAKRIRKSDSISHATPSNSVTSSSFSTNNGSCSTEETTMWECGICTLLNRSLAPVCGICSTRKPQDIYEKLKFWSCKFCTLDNIVELERCGASGEWRYSHGAPVAKLAPNRGT